MDASERAAMSAREIWTAILVASYLAIQIGIPLRQLQAPRPARFGWQMYSALNTPRLYTSVRADGSTERIDIGQYVSQLRAEADFARALPSAICDKHPEAIEVRFRILPERTDRAFPCSR